MFDRARNAGLMPPGVPLTIPAPMRRNATEPALPMLRSVVRAGGQSPMFLSLDALSPTASAKAAERNRAHDSSPDMVDRFKEILSPKLLRRNSGSKGRSPSSRAGATSPASSPAERIKEILKPHIQRRNSASIMGAQDAWQHRVLRSPRVLRDKLANTLGGGSSPPIIVQEIVDGNTRHVSFPDLSARPVHRGDFDFSPPSIEQVFKYHPEDPVGSGPLVDGKSPLKSCLAPSRLLSRRKVRAMSADDRESAAPLARGIVTVGAAEGPLSPVKTRFHSMYDDCGMTNSIFDF